MTYSEELVLISTPEMHVEGGLRLPTNAKGLIIFAHGSGSSRFSPRNNYVASYLSDYGLATLLVDLLSPEEDRLHQNRFNIALLSERLLEVINWAADERRLSGLRFGLFGASTGAASALICACQIPQLIYAVVSRGGRPDLAEPVLPAVKAPTLLIVGGADETVIALNRQAYELLECEKKITIIPGATHLFEEPGMLEQVAQHTGEWFSRYLTAH
jgi:putative phosphoribosyl transferase